MSFETYFARDVLLGVAFLAMGAVVALADSIRRHRRGLVVQEPYFSVVVVVLTWVGAYFGAAGLALLTWRDGAAFLCSVMGIGGTASGLAIRQLRIARRISADARTRIVSLTEMANLAGAVGIAAVYQSIEDERLYDRVREMVRGQRMATLLAPDWVRLLTSECGLARAVREGCAAGMKLRVFGPRSPNQVLPRPDGNVTLFECDGQMLPARLVLLSDRRLLFALRPAGPSGPVFAGEVGGTDGLSLPGEMAALVEDLQTFLDNGRTLAEVRTATSPAEYKSLIVPGERGAKSIDRIPKRIFVVFKDAGTVEAIAAMRFGPASPSVAHYVEEHTTRRQQFFAELGSGMVCREVYSRNELLQYAAERRHGGVDLPRELILNTLRLWKEAVRLQRNYFVGITDDPLPFKYELIDKRRVVLHEAVGVSSLHRLNAVSIEGGAACRAFVDDFELIWERIPTRWRDREVLSAWIESDLYPAVAAQPNIATPKPRGKR